MIKKILKIISVVLFVVIVCVLSLVTTIDETPYKEMDYYKNWKNAISSSKLSTSKVDSSTGFQIGFSKVSITPPYPTPMAGYGNRRGEKYKNVLDSIFVRTIVISNGIDTIALCSADLLIIPPTVYEQVNKKLEGLKFKKRNCYFGATHSHNSVGGWYDTLVGKLFAGTYDPTIETMISNAVVQSIVNAKRDLIESEISYEEDLDIADIRNRLVEEKGIVDPIIRSLIFKSKAKKPVIFTTYAAHATVLDSKTMQLSRDYPGIVVDSLESTNFDFAVFMAGAVGSMGPQPRGKDDYDEINNQGKSVSIEIQSENEFSSKSISNSIRTLHLELPLRKPSPRITQKFALRPWVFYKLFGKSEVFVNAVQLGNNLLIGMPCDFSGELMKPLSAYAKSKGLNLIITSFNGSYIGYVTDDKHFKTDTYETITMNWYGPYNGEYLSEVTKDLIDKFAL